MKRLTGAFFSQAPRVKSGTSTGLDKEVITFIFQENEVLFRLFGGVHERLLDQARLDIAKDPDVHAVDMNDPGNGFRAPIAQADESDAYPVYFGSCPPGYARWQIPLQSRWRDRRQQGRCISESVCDRS